MWVRLLLSGSSLIITICSGGTRGLVKHESKTDVLLRCMLLCNKCPCILSFTSVASFPKSDNRCIKVFHCLKNEWWKIF